MSYSGHLIGQHLSNHLEEGDLVTGKEIGIRIDQTLTQDATGTLVCLELMYLGVDRVKTCLSVSYVDHNTLQTGYENADDHLFLKTAASRYGVYFSRPGNGISHQVHLERFGVPGQTLLGSDSHTPSAGGLGMLSIGAGGMDVAEAMAGGLFYLNVPQVMLVNLIGELPPWVGAKDVILNILGRVTVQGGRGWAFEYGGSGVKSLSIPERATIANMGAETGALTSIFPSDEQTRRFLKAQNREGDFRPYTACEGVKYDEEIVIDLPSLEPMVACPSSPDNVVSVTELEGLKVDQVVVGSCTNSSFRDLKTVSEVIRGKKVNPDVSLVIAPGSKQILTILAKDGALGDLMDAGARILEVACGPCIGMGQAPPSNGVSVRTFNRNFPGRSGTRDADVYLTGPQIAALAALTGRIQDPRKYGVPPPVDEPAVYPVDDSMIIPPSSSPEDVSVYMGPNIKQLPPFDPLPDFISCEVLVKLGDHISTDDILPGGPDVLPLRSNIAAIADHVLKRHLPDFARRAREAGTGIIIGGENYGQGSSREHAAIAPGCLGVRAVLALSFARLHRSNLINFGVLPLTIGKEYYKRIEEGDILEIPGVRTAVMKDDGLTITNPKKGLKFNVGMDFSSRERKRLLAGGRLNYLRQKNAEL